MLQWKGLCTHIWNIWSEIDTCLKTVRISMTLKKKQFRLDKRSHVGRNILNDACKFCQNRHNFGFYIIFKISLFAVYIRPLFFPTRLIEILYWLFSTKKYSSMHWPGVNIFKTRLSQTSIFRIMAPVNDSNTEFSMVRHDYCSTIYNVKNESGVYVFIKTP